MGTSSCERDDICADITATTPHLKIKFYDIANPDNLKKVRKISARGYDLDDNEIEKEIFLPENLDSIMLPLRFETEGISTTSKFVLERSRDYFLDSLPNTTSNRDIITVTYTPKFEYVSRACGYKSIFTNVSITVIPDTDNWIKSSELVNSTIENETETHIILRH